MKSVFLILSLSMVLSACGHHCQSTQVVQLAGTNTTTTVTNTGTGTVNALQQLLTETNASRYSQGQDALEQGLSCTLYTVPTSTTSIATASLTWQFGWLYQGVFNQTNSSVTSGLNILPTNVQSNPLFQTWIVTKCTGYLMVTDNNYHSFDLNSDDGSLLYVDGLLINNDGLHVAQTVSSSKYLQYGAHWFEIDFLQGAGYQSLILNEDGSVMPNGNLYH